MRSPLQQRPVGGEAVQQARLLSALQVQPAEVAVQPRPQLHRLFLGRLVVRVAQLVQRLEGGAAVGVNRTTGGAIVRVNRTTGGATVRVNRSTGGATVRVNRTAGGATVRAIILQGVCVCVEGEKDSGS